MKRATYKFQEGRDEYKKEERQQIPEELKEMSPEKIKEMYEMYKKLKGIFDK